ncbi:MAG: DNA polymerase III subunit delta' [Jaaginema sp. PMC 1079.18]|nr:DNA polymerase III subunit delta' [Jaaginema sp. PMC 1080.18]MEC4853246.1 DNA polymerase III subunit delta' [Jaaginema sp. PMC 1079.18]MEC4867960.1 DNA polymerase III subunit delta' [Jaaginema sp. PMC 1078.18]
MNHYDFPIGQSQAVELLEQAVERDRVAPAYLFVGIAGIGKSLAAERFSALLLSYHKPEISLEKTQKRVLAGNHPDFLRVEPTYLHQGQRLTAQEATEMGLKRRAKPQIRIEQIREIVTFLGRPPIEASRTVVVIEAAQAMPEAAANALLKTLEEPGRATIILLAPKVEALLSTLVSRCQRIPFQPLSQAQMQVILQQKGHSEVARHSKILAIAQGSPGQAIQAWQQLQEIPGDLLNRLEKLPQDTAKCLALAQEIDKTLDVETQLWLLEYLQHQYWHWQDFRQAQTVLQALERSRLALQSYASPRLVWEVLLWKLNPPR